MPIRIDDDLPVKKTLEDENIFVMGTGRAHSQDIRPLDILILNLMPLKEDTELQLMRSLSNTPLQVNITLLRTMSYESKNVTKGHLDRFYEDFDSVKNRKWDGFIITGAPVEKMEFENVDYWDELREIMDWSETNVTSTMHICWGAQAGLYYRYGVQKFDLPKKLSGIYEHHTFHKRTPLVRGFDDVFYVPHSRYTGVSKEDIVNNEHLEIVASKLAARYKVEITLETPKVAFRETIRKQSDVDSKYKKQSGGHGQYGHVKMRFAPSGDLEIPYEFDEEVVGGAVPKNYFPAVEKGLQESVVKGPLAGYPVVGVKATLYDGSYHPVDSSEMAFKTATIQAFKKGFMEASPVLLEPIVSVKVTVPDEYTGDVMGDLNKRRGRVLGMTPVGAGNQIVEADVPMTGLFGYCTTLRSMTGGRGTYEYTFARYEQAPSEVQEAEIAKRAAEE